MTFVRVKGVLFITFCLLSQFTEVFIGQFLTTICRSKRRFYYRAMCFYIGIKINLKNVEYFIFICYFRNKNTNFKGNIIADHINMNIQYTWAYSTVQLYRWGPTLCSLVYGHSKRGKFQAKARVNSKLNLPFLYINLTIQILHHSFAQTLVVQMQVNFFKSLLFIYLFYVIFYYIFILYFIALGYVELVLLIHWHTLKYKNMALLGFSKY